MVAIKLHKLEIVLNRLMENLKNKNLIELSFDEDWYWNVPTESISALPELPELTVGSLADDIAFLESLVDEDYDANFLELERLASLFKFLAKQIVYKSE